MTGRLLLSLLLTPVFALEIIAALAAGWLGAIRHYFYLRDDYRTWLKRDLADCDSILELGCGSNSPILQIGYGAKTTGVDIFETYVDEHNRQGHYQHCLYAIQMKLCLRC